MHGDGNKASDLYSIAVTTWDRKAVCLEQYRGQVLLIVNVASECGFTPQYAGLEALYRKYRDRAFSVLAFPCNQFGAQEPGSDAAIHAFCQESYEVTFPLFSKIDVNGPQAHPLFVFLKSQKAGVMGSSAIKWNFTKFLVDRSGRVATRFGSTATTESMEPRVVALLGDS